MTSTLRPRVISAAEAAADPGATEDSYLAKLIKYIPGEIVAAYIAAYDALTGVSDVPIQTAQWVVAAVLTVLTPFWVLYAAGAPGKTRPVFQAMAATLAFVIWMFAMPAGPFSHFPWYRSVYGFLALLLATLLFPLAEKVVARPPKNG